MAAGLSPFPCAASLGAAAAALPGSHLRQRRPPYERVCRRPRAHSTDARSGFCRRGSGRDERYDRREPGGRQYLGGGGGGGGGYDRREPDGRQQFGGVGGGYDRRGPPPPQHAVSSEPPQLGSIHRSAPVFDIVTGEPFKQSAELTEEPIKMKG